MLLYCPKCEKFFSPERHYVKEMMGARTVYRDEKTLEVEQIVRWYNCPECLDVRLEAVLDVTKEGL